MCVLSILFVTIFISLCISRPAYTYWTIRPLKRLSFRLRVSGGEIWVKPFSDRFLAALEMTNYNYMIRFAKARPSIIIVILRESRRVWATVCPEHIVSMSKGRIWGGDRIENLEMPIQILLFAKLRTGVGPITRTSSG